ncbi:VirB4-like conjugal transfer ATPase, CD1110 family [Ruminococcus sp. XPD3002]|uniref:VirB4-like conjugal transfer ATPase, CD1110 family n=1 Tax=Ruminococcus sp. XPD3002 TaxID=1452269 RepID=UPI00091B6CE8|nr:Type IV secretory pathway, VirB4 component [Ruminococcus flavefaciens]
MKLFKKKKKTNSAKERDKNRLASEAKKNKKEKKPKKEKRQIKRTTIQTMPYECFVSNYIMLNKTGVKIGKQTANLYSKTYLVPDINYSAVTRDQQEELQALYIELLNGFDDTASLQISIMNTQINKEEFGKKLLLKNKDDGLDSERQEFNDILKDKITNGQNGLQCRKLFTVTVAAINFDTANTRFFNIEAHMINCLTRMGTEIIPLTANDRVRLMADILRDVECKITPCTREEFARKAEKQHCCPEYMEFKKDYFLFNDKYARCIAIQRYPATIIDTIFKSIIELNQTMIITENLDFVEQSEAVRLLQKKNTDMQFEAIVKVKHSSSASKGAFVDPIEGTQLQKDMVDAQEFLTDLQEKNEKMLRGHIIIMLTADTFDELEQNTDALKIILRKYQLQPMKCAGLQEEAFCSVLPVGNSSSIDKEHNLQVRRTLSSSATAGFMPFNSKELLHEDGLYYGQNKITQNLIIFNRRRLKNPNGFILGVPGSGKSFLAKLEMIYSILQTDEEILILDPEGEYTAIAELLGGEVIYISENSKTHINPLDLTENPNADDKEYDPIKAKLDFLLSFFSTILGNQEITPIQKTIIDDVMHITYKNHDNPTLKEYYSELENYEKGATDETKSAVTYLRQTLHLYVHGSMNVFSNPSNVNINKRIVVYNIKELGKNLQTLGMMIVLENLWDRVAKNRSRNIGTRIYIDEMYLLFKSEQSANFFYELYKRARKWGGVPTGITQNVEDLLRSDLARTMLSNTQFVVMLSQNATDREQLSRLLRISDDTMNYVTNASPGSGLLYADEYGIIPFENKFPTNTHIYDIITTKFGETKSVS